METSPSLGIIVSQLKNCVEYYNREKCAHDALLRQRKSLEASLNINQKGIFFTFHIAQNKQKKNKIFPFE